MLFACSVVTFFSNFSCYCWWFDALLLRLRFFPSSWWWCFILLNWMSFNVLPRNRCVFVACYVCVCVSVFFFWFVCSFVYTSKLEWLKLPLPKFLCVFFFLFQHWIKLTLDRLNVRICGSLFRSGFIHAHCTYMNDRSSIHWLQPLHLNSYYYKASNRT